MASPCTRLLVVSILILSGASLPAEAPPAPPEAAPAQAPQVRYPKEVAPLIAAARGSYAAARDRFLSGQGLSDRVA